jgi:NAD(P)-dependent dehydrogenase (short-subunit alcohol dehydrogenase family)
MRLPGKKAVILGGAGRIGGVLVERFLENGAEVLAVDRAEQALVSLIEELPEASRRQCHPLAADIVTQNDAADLVDNALKVLGGIDILIHLTGGIYRAAFVEHALKEFDELWQANVRTPFLACQAFARFMEGQRHGKIILFSAVGGVFPQENHSGYCAAKAACIAFARVAALELAPKNVQINIIAPGPTETVPFRSRYYLDNPQVLAQIEARTPAGRIGHPEDHAGLVLFLASDESEWITGQVIFSDGGLSLT